MQKISVSGPAELATIVPYHLGFQPERSVVVICLRDKAVGLVARVDVVGRSDAAQAAAQLCEPIVRDGATAVVLVSYEDVAGEARPLAEALGAALGLTGITVLEDVVVRGGRWHVVGADRSESDGAPLPAVADVPAIAGYVAQGRSVLGDRRAVEALVQPERAAHDEEAAAAVAQWRQRYWDARAAERVALTDECLAAWGTVLRGEASPSAVLRLVPALVGPLDDRDLRDALIAWLCPGWLPLEAMDGRLLTQLGVLVGDVEPGPARGDDAGVVCQGSDVEDVLLALCRVTPVRFAAAVLAIAAAYAWFRGDGTRAGLCVDRALDIEPEHRLAGLIRLGLDHGVRMPAA